MAMVALAGYPKIYLTLYQSYICMHSCGANVSVMEKTAANCMKYLRRFQIINYCRACHRYNRIMSGLAVDDCRNLCSEVVAVVVINCHPTDTIGLWRIYSENSGE